MTAGTYPGLTRVVSGGQTGVDRAALDAAMALGLPVGGWCPPGRKAEDGEIPGRYPLTETRARGYAPRTRKNVRDAQATLILTGLPASGGTRLTIEEARRLAKPHLVADPELVSASDLAWWIRSQGVAVLNVAGPKESKLPGIQARAYALLYEAFGLVSGRPGAGPG